MSDPKSPDDLFDAPMPGMSVPTPPGLTETPVPVRPRDPSDADASLSAAPPSAPPPAQAPPAKDPAALAKELAEKAKKKAQQAAPAKDPAALAKELAEKAKKKAQQAAPAKDPAALARELAEKAKKKAKATAPPAPEPAMPPLPPKKRSAAEILAEAREREARERAARERPAAPPKAKAPPAPRPAAAPTGDPTALVQSLFPGGAVHGCRAPSSDVALRAVWRAHLARAQAGGDAALIVAASAVLGALDRLGTQGLIVADVELAGARHAVFVDATSGAAIATAQPADVYLAGS